MARPGQGIPLANRFTVACCVLRSPILADKYSVYRLWSVNQFYSRKNVIGRTHNIAYNVTNLQCHIDDNTTCPTKKRCYIRYRMYMYYSDHPCVGGKFDFVWQVGVFIELPSEGSLLNLLLLLEQLAIPYFTCLADLHRGRPGRFPTVLRIEKVSKGLR